ncbi:MAG: response regulator, partial [Anaerolineales bacterium]
MRILIIEDSEEDTQLVLRELGRDGYEVEFERVETAEAMQSALAQKTWDLILSDYTMPKFNALKALEVLEASGLDLPFIIISGTIGEETAVAALKAGAHDFLIKGNFARLGPAIERELREAESRRERRQAEAALKSSETRYRLAASATNDVIWEWDSKTNELMWSENAQFVFGYMPEEIKAQAAWWDEHIHPEDRERV